MKKQKRKYYVSYYEEYPVYEPAEGGYYYACDELIESYTVGSLKSAKRLFKKLLNEYDMPHIRCTYSHDSNKYIGSGRTLRIETVQGIHETYPHNYE